MTEKTVTAYENLPFAPFADGNPVELSPLWGNPATGPAAVLIRVPKGHQEPWHNHSSSYRLVVIEGKFKTLSKDSDTADIYESEVVGPGSYTIQPGGALHSEVNAGSSDLVALVYFDGPIDVVLEN